MHQNRKGRINVKASDRTKPLQPMEHVMGAGLQGVSIRKKDKEYKSASNLFNSSRSLPRADCRDYRVRGTAFQYTTKIDKKKTFANVVKDNASSDLEEIQLFSNTGKPVETASGALVERKSAAPSRAGGPTVSVSQGKGVHQQAPEVITIVPNHQQHDVPNHQ